MTQLEICEPELQPSSGPDVAYTPLQVARSLVRALQLRGAFSRGQVVWEMHVGGGSFVRALNQELSESRRATIQLLATDIDGAAPGLFTAFAAAPQPLRRKHDARRGLPDGWPKPHWIIGNPPWSDAAAHLDVALRTATEGIAWILPWAWLLPANRRSIIERAFPDEILAFSERVPFEGPQRTKGSPPRDSALYIWRRRPSGRADSPPNWHGRGLMSVFSHRTGMSYGGVTLT